MAKWRSTWLGAMMRRRATAALGQAVTVASPQRVAAVGPFFRKRGRVTQVLDNLSLTSESLAVWYFRLNGVFTIPNFVLHPRRQGSARTDIDVAGVRFPFRLEFDEGPGGDDP